MHIAVSTVSVKASSKYSIIIICLCLEMQEGIEPTISTIPLGCTNEIVSGDQPSTVSGNHSQHTISFSSECGWIPCEPLARDSTGCREQNPSFDSVLIHIIFTTIPPNSSLFWHKVSILILIPSEVYKFVSIGWCVIQPQSPESRGLVLPFWSLKLISSPSHRPSTFELCDLLMSLSRTWTTSKLCRWLGGEIQRI